MFIDLLSPPSTISRFENGKSTDYQGRILVGHRKAGLLVHRLFEGTHASGAFTSHDQERASRFYFHVPAANLFVGPSAPDDVSRRAVEIRQIVERHERHVLHKNFAGLLE